jgi:hypothetical protein
VNLQEYIFGVLGRDSGAERPAVEISLFFAFMKWSSLFCGISVEK